MSISSLKVVCALSMVAAFLVIPAGARADYASDFEALNASSSGVVLTGQDGYYLPSGTDFNVYTYAGNALGFAPNPRGGEKFIAVTGPGGGVYGRAQHDIDYSTSDRWTMSFDMAAKYLGDPATTPGNNLGSISLQPSGTSTSVIPLARWTAGDEGNSWAADYVWYDAAGTQLREVLPDTAFQNLQLDHWYNWATTFDLATNQVVEVELTDLTTNTTASYSPTDRYLQFGTAGGDAPTAFRFFSGGGVAGNTLAFDNVQIAPPSADEIIPEPATMALLGLACAGLGGYVRRRRKA